MSDHRGEMTPQELDELASAYLDGEATAQEAALVESDPRLQALVEELRAVRNLVAAPVEPPTGEVQDQMIARALDQRAPVVSLESGRRRLRSVPPQARVVLAAAAVVAVIAMVGVTVFDQVNRGGDDSIASDDSTSAPAMAEEMSMDEPASAPLPESAESADESMVLLEVSPSDDSEMADEPAEAMDDEASVVEPESPEEEMSFAAEAPAEDSPDDEPMMAAEPVEATQLAGEAPLVFDTQGELEAYAMQFVDDLVAAQGAITDEVLRETQSLACPLFTEEEVDLLERFSAVVEGIELEVSIYTGADFSQRELLLVQTTPPPECAIHGLITAMGWSSSHW